MKVAANLNQQLIQHITQRIAESEREDENGSTIYASTKYFSLYQTADTVLFHPPLPLHYNVHTTACEQFYHVLQSKLGV